MMLKRYIDSQTVEDVPQNGIITIDIEENGEIVETQTGVSNLPQLFERDTALANRNGYYEYVESDIPECGEDEYIDYEYVFENGVITRVYTVRSGGDEQCNS